MIPAYRDLPRHESGIRSAWGIFGATDQIGTMNLLTRETVAAAAAEVVTGKVFALNADLTEFDPPLYSRQRASHVLLPEEDDAGFDETLTFNPQSSSQWDSLAHVAGASGRFYNGATPRDIRDEGRNGIVGVARRGIAGRGVLLDFEAVARERDDGYHPGRPLAVTVDDLERCLTRAGTEWKDGDIAILHTGFLPWYRRQPAGQRKAMADSRQLTAAGLEHSEEMAAYLWDSRLAAVVSDNPAVEVWPPGRGAEHGPFGFLHHALLGFLGIMLGELWKLDALAADCRQDGRYTAFVTSAPLPIARGVSSPANAVAVK